MSNSDDLKGRFEQAASDPMGDHDLQNEGRIRAAGKVKRFLDDVEDKASGAVAAVKDKLDRS